MARNWIKSISLLFIPALVLNIKAAVVITEIHYHPLESTTSGSAGDGDLYEFVEIKNTGTAAVNLSGYSFTNGITFTFPSGTTVAAGSFFVVASDQLHFNSRYGFMPNGQFTGSLNNSGETITLSDSSGNKVDKVEYKESSPWPTEPDGSGNSLVAADPNRTGDPKLYSSWRASSKIHGSPGADDPQITTPKILINEIMSNTNLAQGEYIELFNPESVSVDISGWYLTDNRNKPQKFKVPANKVIPARGYLLFTASEFNVNDSDSTSFQFDPQGEEAFVFAVDQQGNLTGYNNGVTFGEIGINISFGRHVTSTGEAHFVAQASNTPGTANSGPFVGKFVISEIMYNASNGVEYLELLNNSDDTLPLYDIANSTNVWKVNGVGFDFPPLTKVKPHQIVLLIDDTVSIDGFRTLYQLSNDIPVFSYTGTLKGGSETIRLERPETPDTGIDSKVKVPYMTIDWITYGTSSPWPANADGWGQSLHRVKYDTYANDPANWKGAAPSPGSLVTAIKPGFNKSFTGKVQVGINANSSIHTYSISLYLPRTELICADLFDCRGRLHTRLMNEKFGSGLHSKQFNMLQNLGNNVLFLRVKASGKTVHTSKLTIVQ